MSDPTNGQSTNSTPANDPATSTPSTGGGSPGVPTTGNEPNHFDLTGNGARLTYDTSSIAGQPQFQFHDGQHDAHSSGDDIQVENSAIGRLVTARADLSAIGTTRVTLVVPEIRLRDSTETEIETIAIVTSTQLEGLPTVREHYQVLHLRGTASVVDF